MQELGWGWKQEDSPGKLYKKELDPRIFSLALHSQGLLLLYHLADDRFTLWRDFLIPVTWSIAEGKNTKPYWKESGSHKSHMTDRCLHPQPLRQWTGRVTALQTLGDHHSTDCSVDGALWSCKVALGELVSFCPPSSHLRPCICASNRKQRGKIIDAYCNSNSSYYPLDRTVSHDCVYQ